MLAGCLRTAGRSTVQHSSTTFGMLSILFRGRKQLILRIPCDHPSDGIDGSGLQLEQRQGRTTCALPERAVHSLLSRIMYRSCRPCLIKARVCGHSIRTMVRKNRRSHPERLTESPG
jgi:hypothetical protein